MRNRIIRVLAVLIFFIAIYWLWQSADTSQFSFDSLVEPSLAVLGTISTLAAYFWPEKSTANTQIISSPRRLAKDRQSLIDALYILFDERLSQTLEDDLRAQLNLDYTPQAAQDRRWLNRHGLPNDLLADEDTTKIFHAAKRKLLILGKPGAGKTTTLYRLGAQLLKEATPENNVPLPIVFELSRWAQNPDVSIHDWLTTEMKDRFAATKDYWTEWIDLTSPRIIPLLDGFDEVPEAKRQRCAEAINEFARFETVPLVVCSRIDEYALLEEKLAINAVEIQELSEEQINTYMQFLDTDIDLRTLLRQHPELMDLAKQPLFLNILALTGFEEADLKAEGDSFQTKNIFSRFIGSRFKTDSAENPPHSQEKTLKWLRWLAWQMEQHDKMQQFEIEGLQPNWLKTSFVRIYLFSSAIAISTILGLILLFTSGILYYSIGLLFGLPAVGQSMAFSVAILGCSIALSFNNNLIKPVERVSISFSLLNTGVFGFVEFIDIFILIVDGDLIDRFIITPILVILIIFLVILPPEIRLFLFSIFLAMMLILFSYYTIAISTANSRIDIKGVPNEGVRRSSRLVVFFGCFYTVLFGLVLPVFFAIIISMFTSINLSATIFVFLIFGITIGINFGIIAAFLDKGGRAVLQHIVLREMLYRQDHMPRNYARFLNYCVRLRLLVRVGGSYKFLHRLLQEHFAAEYEDTTS